MFITSDIGGGLGNQLFMIANLLQVSKSQKIKYYISKSKNQQDNGNTLRPFYWDTVFHKLIFSEDDTIKWDTTIKEINPNFFTNIPEITQNTIFIGYFQSSKYFDKDIINNFQLPEDDQTIVNNIFNSYVSLYPSKRINFLHVRRGDYLKYPHFHFSLTADWYRKAYQNFPDDECFLIFSDDLDWCVENLFFIKNRHFISDTDYRELFLMSLCDGGIISNSTFSWWGAYLGKENKKIICPDIWYKDFFDQRNFRNEPNWINEKVDFL